MAKEEEKATVQIEVPEGMSEEEFKKQLASFTKAPKEKKTGDDIIFKTLEYTDLKQAHIERTFYKGKEYFAFRWYWREDKSETWKPGKGFSFDPEDIEDLISGLEAITTWMENGGE